MICAKCGANEPHTPAWGLVTRLVLNQDTHQMETREATVCPSCVKNTTKPRDYSIGVAISEVTYGTEG